MHKSGDRVGDGPEAQVHILIVDDFADNREMYAEYLAFSGFQVSEAVDGHEALRKAGVPQELVVVEGAPHSFHLEPKEQDLRPKVLAFFDRHLKGPAVTK